MSHFYGHISSDGKDAPVATKQGHQDITGHIRTWHLGIRVVGAREEHLTCFQVYLTGGRLNPDEQQPVVAVYRNDKTGEISVETPK